MQFNSDLPIYRVGEQMSIGVPVEKLWKLISMPENLNLCHPYCKKNTVQKWGGIGAKDTLEYYNGLTLVREFVEWKEGQGYKLIIGKNELATARVTWSVTELTKESSELSISIELLPYVALRRFTPWLRILIRRFYFIPKMKHYIHNVVQGFKYYAEHKTPVSKNQFGYNAMFSIK